MAARSLIALAAAAGFLSVFQPDCRAAEGTPAGTAHNGKQLPQDTAPWRREPFRKIEEPSAAGTPARQNGAPGMKQLAPPGGAVRRDDNRPADELVLQGIMQTDGRHYAIINGRTVRSGERIDGWNVATITRYRVTVRREKETQTLDIYQGRIDRGKQ